MKGRSKKYYRKIFRAYPDMVTLLQFREMLSGVSDNFARKLIHEKHVKSIFIKPHYYISKNSVCQAFCKSENVEAQRVVLMICSEYDAMNHPVPEAIWWISGSKLLVPPFIEGFLSYLREYLKELEVM